VMGGLMIGIHPRAVILIAPFTSITDLLDECVSDTSRGDPEAYDSFWLFGFIPLLSPLKSIAFALGR